MSRLACPVCHAFSDVPQDQEFIFCRDCGARFRRQEGICTVTLLRLRRRTWDPPESR